MTIREVLNMGPKHSFFCLLLLMLPFSPVPGQRSDDSVKKELMRITREAIAATLRNDMAVWEDYLADDYIETDESGVVKTKSQVIKDFHGLPIFADPKIDIENVDIRVYDMTAIMYYRGYLRMTVGGHPLTEGLQLTDVYMLRGGKWKLVAEHQSRFPLPVKGVSVDEKTLRSYAGAYRIAPLVIVNFIYDHGKLMRQMLGDSRKDELVPETESTFFIKGQLRQIVFERDSGGKVVASIYRLPDGQKVRAVRIE